MTRIALHELRQFTIIDGDSGGDSLVTLVPSDPIDAGEGNLLEVLDWKCVIFQGTITRVRVTGAGFQVIQAEQTSVSSNTGEYDDVSRLVHNVEAAKKYLDGWQWEQFMKRLKEL